MRRMLIALALAALLGFALVACGVAPVAMASLPAYPGVAELQSGENVVADSVAESLTSAVAGNLTSEVKLFSLPAATTWDEVTAFYGEALQSGDWTSATELASSNDALSTAGWKRGSPSNEQVLMVGFVPPVLDKGPVLIVALFSQ